MTLPTATPFLFAVCQLGAEAALKQELVREHPELRFAYSRPGLLTFKSAGLVSPAVALRAVFARAWGASLGPSTDPADVAMVARTLRHAQGNHPVRLHVWARDVARPGEEPPDDANEERVAAVRALLAGTMPKNWAEGATARAGELVLDVVVPPEGDEPWWVGCHKHDASHSPHPGGRIPIVMPPEAPSRAYRKLEEALAWSGARLRRGDVAVEIGSAPGGASYALLRRGVHVVGVDPGAMAELVLGFEGPGGARFRHVQQAVGGVHRADLPPHVDWLLCDVNLAPQVALHSMRRLVAALKGSLKGLLFTLKLNDWEMAAEVPALVARVAGMGLPAVRVTQLPSNRQEIFVYAPLTPRRHA